MATDALPLRGLALEQSYSRRIGAGRLRAGKDRARAVEELGEELGIRDGRMLGSLVDLGITAETAAAFEALPLVAVAWADGDVDEEERWRVLEVATSFGMEMGRSAHAQVELWLTREPPPELLDAWLRFAFLHLRGPHDAAKRDRIRTGVDRVARAAGGVLGFALVSAAERRVIDRICRALAAPAAPN